MSVYKAINAVQSAISKIGISKDRINEKQKYKFRGIDDIYDALAPLLAEHGLCILPRIISRSMTERETQNGGVIFYTILEAEFDFVYAEDGSKHTVKVYGEAMDTSDKSTNKAMSAAYKYACLQAFCIPTEGDNDEDQKTHEVKKNLKITPTGGAMERIESAERRDFIKDIAGNIIFFCSSGDVDRAIEEVEMVHDVDERVALWSLLDSKIRTSLKKRNEELKKIKESGNESKSM